MHSLALAQDSPFRYDNDKLTAILRQFLAETEARVRAHGLSGGLRPALRAAVLACPRHFFVRRYIPHAGADTRDLAAGPADLHLPAIYRDAPLGHVDAAGAPLASTNSQPSIVLHLLELLDLQPGQRVLEIGSGCGWMLGLIARAIGPEGIATGIEIIPELAEQSRQSLAAAGIANARVIAADGIQGCAAAGTFDRIIFTTGLRELPEAYFTAVTPGGLLVAPFQIKGIGNDALALRRMEAGGFRAEAALSCTFIYPSGGLAQADDAPVSLPALPLWQELAFEETLRLPFTFGQPGYGVMPLASATMALRSFLTKREPRFVVFRREDAGLPANPQLAGGAGGIFDVAGFGIVDTAARSLAVCNGAELIGFGTRAAADRLLALYRDWADLLMPGVEAFDAELWPQATAPALRPGWWAEPRGACVFHWSLKPDWPRVSRLKQGAAQDFPVGPDLDHHAVEDQPDDVIIG